MFRHIPAGPISTFLYKSARLEGTRAVTVAVEPERSRWGPWVKRRSALGALLGIAFLLLSPAPVHATAIAESEIAATNVQISASTGSVVFTAPFLASAFAEALNSLGELDQAIDSSAGTALANASVTYAAGTGSAAAVEVSESASSSVNVSGQPDLAASSVGRGRLEASFMITGGVGAVDVDFSADVNGLLHVFTDSVGLLAETEVAFSLLVDGTTVLFHHDMLSVGPNSAPPELLVAQSLFQTISLQFDTSYSLLLEVDSESRGINLPEPISGLMFLAGLGFTICVKRGRAQSHLRGRRKPDPAT